MPEIEPVDIVLVTSPRCHLCDEARQILDDMNHAIPLRVRTVDLSSDEGVALVVEHRIPFPPVLFVGGELFGFGRVSRRKLERHLMRMVVDTAEA